MRRLALSVVLVGTLVVAVAAPNTALAQSGPTLVVMPDCRTLANEQVYGVKVSATGLAPNAEFTIRIEWTYIDRAGGGGSTSAATFSADANGNFASFDFSTVGVKTSYTATLVYAGQTLTKTIAVTCEQPTTKEQCTTGGWKNFPGFNNQGDCVSFVATGGKNPPAH